MRALGTEQTGKHSVSTKRTLPSDFAVSQRKAGDKQLRCDDQQQGAEKIKQGKRRKGQRSEHILNGVALK